MGPLASRPSLVATVGRRARHTSAPVGGTCTSSLWRMVNWRPLASLPGTTSHKVSDYKVIWMSNLYLFTRKWWKWWCVKQLSHLTVPFPSAQRFRSFQLIVLVLQPTTFCFGWVSALINPLCTTCPGSNGRQTKLTKIGTKKVAKKISWCKCNSRPHCSTR